MPQHSFFPQFLWSLSALLSGSAIVIFFQWIAAGPAGAAVSPGALSTRAERERLRRVQTLLRELEETLASGVVPAPARWEALRALPAPWGALAHESVTELRQQGGAVLPTLQRLRALAVEQDTALVEARARSAQALGQAVACIALVPLFAAALYLVLPAVSERPLLWAALTACALVLAAFGAAWILRLAHEARWGGLRGEQRAWLLGAQCAGERFLALLRTGNPPDSAWIRSCEFLARESPALAAAWGASVWAAPEGAGSAPGGGRSGAHGGVAATARPDSAGSALIEAGRELKKAVQVALMEGRACSERVESALAALRVELRARRERELGLLGSRALKPLFLCLAPALLGLLAAGVALAWLAQGGAGAWL